MQGEEQRLRGRYYQGEAADALWLDGDIEILKRCDALLMTPDWARSTGARAEKTEAERSGIPVFLTLADLAAWLQPAVST